MFTTMRVLERITNMFLAVNPAMTVRAMQVFSAVAVDEGRTVTEYMMATGLPKTTVSRTLLDLSETNRSPLKEGADLLSRRASPTNLKEVLYVLSPKGKGLVYRIEKEVDAARASIGVPLSPSRP